MRKAMILVLAAALSARADEPPPLSLSNFGDLEMLALRAEKEGWKRIPLEKVVPAPPKELVYPLATSSIDEEKKFRTAWIAAYKAAGDDIAEQITRVAKDESLLKPKELEGPPEKRFFAIFLKKLGKQRELSRTAELVAPRYGEAIQLAKNPAEKETFELRERELKKFLKRYDFGPGIATSEATGTALIRVQLAPQTYDAVKKYVDSWKFKPLAEISGKKIEYAENIPMGEVREALKPLQNEYFTVRYSKWEKEKEVDALRVSGAKLLLGRYYFIEHGERIVVARDGDK